MAFVLGEEGHDIAAAGNGCDGLAMLQSAPACDAVVIDLNLPGMRGDEIAAQVRSQHPHIIVALVSGHPNPLPGVFGKNVDVFLQKPFRPKVLIAALEGAQEQRRSAA
jgi:CheY-like chemotaxis protein